MCDAVGLQHTQLTAELVVDKFLGQEDETILTIEHALRAIRIQERLIKNDPYMDPVEKDGRLRTVVASVWAQLMTGNRYPFDRLIDPRSDLDILQLVESRKEYLYERVREELEPRVERETP